VVSLVTIYVREFDSHDSCEASELGETGLNYLNNGDTRSASQGIPDPNPIRDEMAPTLATCPFGSMCACAVFLCSFLVALFAKRDLLSLEIPARTQSPELRSLGDAAEEDRLFL